eukprot:15204984-Alexandrium_andersonii.AAC.1
MKPQACRDYLTTAAGLAADASAGMDPCPCTSGGSWALTGAFVYYVDPGEEVAKLALPKALF